MTRIQRFDHCRQCFIKSIRRFAFFFAFGLGVIATVDAEAPEGGFATTRMTITLAIP